MRRVVVVLCALQLCAGSRVLVVFPVPGRSHAEPGDALVKTLLEAGHQVTYVSPSNSLLPHVRLTSVSISSVTQPAADIENLNIMEKVANSQPPQKVLEVGTTFARQALEHNATQQILTDTALSFDVVIADWFYTGLLAPLASIYNCPLIWYSAVDASWMSLQLMHGHTNPAYSVDPQSRSMAAEFGVVERTQRIWRQAYLTGWVYYMTYYVEAPIYYEVYEAPLRLRGLSLPDYESLVYNGSLMLVNSHPLLGQAITLPQSTKYVGGHHIEVPAKPLSKNLQELLDRSTNGVIFFNLGSKIKSKDLPERMKRKLLDLFGHLEHTVIWKFEETLIGLPRNVYILKRAPQLSILNHTNTLLFITHAGFMSCMEATYFGVPIIGIPLSGDQYLTIDLAAARGRGMKVDLTDVLPYRIYDAIHKILGNYSYHRNSLQASAIFQRPLTPPSQELLHWIELVVDRGAGHLRSPVVQLSILQKLHLDLGALILMFLWFCSKVVKVIRVHLSTDDDEEDKKIQ